MARRTGLGKALQIILSANDHDADDAVRPRTISEAPDPEEIGPHVGALAQRIDLFPAKSINACKQMVSESIDMPIDEALKAGACWLCQATGRPPAIKRFIIADEPGLEHDSE